MSWRPSQHGGLVTGSEPAGYDSSDRKSALAVVNSLRRGVPPEYHLESFSVCRDELLAQFRQDLAATGSGSSRLRYIDADLGQGKTHLLKLLRSAAFGQDFIVSIVELSASQCPLYRLTDVYHRIVTGLRTRESPFEPALESIMERWLEKQRTTDPGERGRALARLPNGMQSALLAFLQAKTSSGLLTSAGILSCAGSGESNCP